MGWQGFPDEVTAPKIRAEMLAETIDILTLLYRSRPFDYDGKHYHLRLSQVDEQYYPPKPVQQPRIPLWVVGHWPRQASMQRVLKADGVFVEKINREGQAEAVTPADIRALKAFVDENRLLTTPFDIIATGNTTGMSIEEKQEQLQAWEQAGATWWIEGLWEASPEQVSQRIEQGPIDSLR
jgi:alkanesulfonate monooxygenase SsuD/methylene tetrahydromethanopterin reductase-like flavin-dependent oxidoreductase (luciferase family)